MQNLQRKSDAADKMFAVMVAEMANASGVSQARTFEAAAMPSWVVAR